MTWSSVPDGAFAIWAARTSDLRAFAQTVVEAGEACDVFRVVTVADDGSDPQPFDYRKLLATGIRPFAFPEDAVPTGRRFATSTRLAWSEGGALREGDVLWMGALLEQLNPGVHEDFAEHYMGWVAALEVWGTRDFVHISLRTDAWFPRTLELDPDDLPFELPPPSHDNRVLAVVHTPRLNRFLDALHRAADGWELLEPEGIGKLYADQVDECGIVLE